MTADNGSYVGYDDDGVGNLAVRDLIAGYDRRWCVVHFFAWRDGFRVLATTAMNGWPVCEDCNRKGTHA